jgi:hypothetical protein
LQESAAARKLASVRRFGRNSAADAFAFGSTVDLKFPFGSHRP